MDTMPTHDPDPSREPDEHSSTHWPLLGTVVDIVLTAHDRAAAARAETVICDEISLLEHVFSIYDDTSMLNRWINDASTPTSNEFDELLALALRWQRASLGAFNVSTRGLGNLWARATGDGCRPSPGELHELAADIADAPYRFDGHRLVQVGNCSGLDLNAIAKGFIVDLAADTAWRLCDLENLTISAGGDIAHRGATPVRVGIEDPSTLLDNAVPLFTIDLRNAAVATSGSARRGVSVGKEWISHVLDPRTGYPAYGSASVTVRAPNATTADVVATIVSVLEPAAGLEFIDALNSDRPAGHPAESASDLVAGPISCWIVDRVGGLHRSDG